MVEAMGLIRQAEFPGDLVSVIDLSRKFGAGYAEFPVDEEKTRYMLAGLLDTGVCFVAEEGGVVTGAIVGSVIEHPFFDARFLVEVGWYASPRYAYALLRKFVDTGKALGVNSITASTLNNSPRAASVLLQRVGMTQSEQVWQMKL